MSSMAGPSGLYCSLLALDPSILYKVIELNTCEQYMLSSLQSIIIRTSLELHSFCKVRMSSLRS